jgi:exodeoxyribonuclease VII small subunit
VKARKSNEAGMEQAKDFESALLELEQVVASMERGEMTLEASLKAYQRGVELAQVCQERLSAVEQQVKVLEGELLKPLKISGKRTEE